MLDYRILRYDTLESTNQKAKECADSLGHKDVIVTKEQTSGRGRMGRTWISKKGADLIMSLVLKPDIPTNIISQITLLMAMAVCDGLENAVAGCEDRVADSHFDSFAHILTDKKPLIKWPNDVVISSRKVCGILTESVLMEDKISHLIIGVGVNVGSEDFHLSIENIAGSVKTQWGIELDVDKLLEEILTAFDGYYERFVENQSIGYMVESYNKRLVSIDKEVFVGDRRGLCRGINNSGELMVEFDGRIENICAGEVSVRGLYGYV